MAKTHPLVVFKARLGETFLEALIFLSSCLSFPVYFIFLFFLGKAALERAKPALKQPNRHLRSQTDT